MQRNRSLLSDKNAYTDRIGLEQERSIVYLGPDTGHAVSVVTELGAWKMLTYHWYEDVDSAGKEILYALLARDQSPFRRKDQAKVTRLATYISHAPEGRMLADKRLQTFLQEMTKSEATATPTMR